MPVTSKAPHSSNFAVRSPRKSSPGLWVGASLASVVLHGGLLGVFVTLVHPTSQTDVPLQPTVIPVRFVELPTASPQGEEPVAAIAPAEPPASVEEPRISALVTPADSLAVVPAPIPSVAPTVERSPQPQVTPQTTVEPDFPPSETGASAESESVVAEPQDSPDPLPSPLQPPALAASTLSPLPDLPDALPGSLATPAESPPSLAAVTVADTVEPVEITASIHVQSLLPSAEHPEQRDRQTFTYDPTGQSGGGLSQCPLTPDVQRFAGETVTFQVQLDDQGTVATADIYKSASVNPAYEIFAACLVKNWDFSGLSGADWQGEALMVAVTIELANS